LAPRPPSTNSIAPLTKLASALARCLIAAVRAGREETAFATGRGAVEL